MWYVGSQTYETFPVEQKYIAFKVSILHANMKMSVPKIRVSDVCHRPIKRALFDRHVC